MAEQANLKRGVVVGSGLVAVVLIALFGGVAGNIANNFVPYLACKLARQPTCLRPEALWGQVAIMALCMVLTAAFAWLLYYLGRPLLNPRVRAQNAESLDADLLILPVSLPFDRATMRALGGGDDELADLQAFLAATKGSSAGSLRVGETTLSPEDWRPADLCAADARFRGRSTDAFDLGALTWQQAWRAVLDRTGGDKRLRRIVILPSTRTIGYADCFAACLRAIVERQSGAAAPVCEVARATEFERLDQVQGALRGLIDEAKKAKPDLSVRIDITGGNRVFAAAAVILSAVDSAMVFSYVPDSFPHTPEGYDVIVESRSVRMN